MSSYISSAPRESRAEDLSREQPVAKGSKRSFGSTNYSLIVDCARILLDIGEVASTRATSDPSIKILFATVLGPPVEQPVCVIL